MAKDEPAEPEENQEPKESERPEPKESLSEIGDKLFDKTEAKPEDKEEVKDEKPADKTAPEVAEKSEKPEEKPDDKGYYADEEAEEVETPESDVPAENETANWILGQLPTIPVSGHRGERSVSLNVKRADDLPKDFEFDSQRDAAVFYQAIADQTQRAYQLVNQVQTQRQQAQNDQFTVQENRDIQADIAKLQRSGDLPLFTRGADIDTDPKAETAREVLEFYNKENVKRLEDSQKNGRLFHHLSYEDAFHLWRAQNPQTTKEQKAEDTERKEITRTQARGQRQGAREGEARKINLPRTANWDQVINSVLGD